MDDEKSIPPPTNSMPWLVFTHAFDEDESNLMQTFSTLTFNNKYLYLKSIPAITYKTIIGSQYGWLILQRNQRDPGDAFSITLYNPVTSETIDLPPFHYHRTDPLMVRSSLTSPPNENNCFVFVFFLGWAFCWQCRPSNIEESRWVSKRIEINGDQAFVSMTATLNGVIYAWGCAIDDDLDIKVDCLVSFEVVDDGSSKDIAIRHLQLRLKDTHFAFILDIYYAFMVECGGAIYLAQVGTRHYDGVQSVRVFELDLNRESVIKVHSLGNRALLLATHGSTWCFSSSTCGSTEGGIEGNCLYIYESKFIEEGLVLYRLHDCTSTFLPCPEVLYPRSSFPAWVMSQPQSVDRSSVLYRRNNRSEDNALVLEVVPRRRGTQRSYFSELPLELIQLISKRMHLFDYWSFRCTSKTFNSATPAPRWRSNNALPLLLVYENDHKRCRLMDPCRDYSRSCVLSFSSNYFDFEFSKDGWLLVSDGICLWFFNPFTREQQSLRACPHSYCRIGFSNNPTCMRSAVVAIGQRDPGPILYIYYLRNNDKSWITCRFDENYGSHRFMPGYSSPVYHSGAFYFLDLVGYLGEFHLIDGASAWTVYNKPFATFCRFHSCYLVECNQKLLSVFIWEKGSYIRVVEWNDSNKKWVHINSLGDHVLFICPYSCFAVSTSDMKMQDRIYLPWLKGRKSIVYYSLKTSKYHVNASEEAYNDFFFMQQPSRCCWI